MWLLSLGEGTSDLMQRQQVTTATSAGNLTAGFHTLFPLSSLWGAYLSVTDRAGGGLVACHSMGPPPPPQREEEVQGAGPAIVGIGGNVFCLGTEAERKQGQVSPRGWGLGRGLCAYLRANPKWSVRKKLGVTF